MTTRNLAFGCVLPLALLLTGCTGIDRVNLVEQTGGNAALFAQFQAYDGHSGRPLSFRDIVSRCRGADVILFGEEHSDAVCNQLEAQLLYALASQPRPVALALEFFEADTQAALDAYLRGRTTEPAFRKQTRQGRAYVLAHRPLIELCRTADIPAVAANVPRRLVRDYRKSELSYEEYRAGLEAADQCWLPLTNTYLTGPYEDRFFDLMSGHEAAVRPTTQPASAPATQAASAPAAPPTPHPASAPATMPATPPTTQPTSMPTSRPHPPPVSQPVTAMPAASKTASYYRSQLLWDQSMAESLATFRARFPNHRVMLIVGGFHVAHTGGTARKFHELRPHDRIVTVAYHSTTDGRFEFDEEDRGAGDIVIYGIKPPPKKKRPTTMPTTAPTTQPETQPATDTAPATPTTSPIQPPVVLREIPLRDALVIGNLGRSSRSPVHTDALEAQLIRGAWSAPEAGQTIELPDGSVQEWTALSATDDDWFRHAALRGGYAYATFESDRDQAMLLAARGHSMVYVNGAPRGGDPYRTGHFRLPVRLHQGTNEFLFRCARGELQAKLIEPASPISLDLHDATLPDLIVGEEAATWAAVVILNATDQPLHGAVLVAHLGTQATHTKLPSIEEWSARKVAFQITPPAQTAPGQQKMQLILQREGRPDVVLAQAEAELRVRQPHESHKRTFISSIDGSVQFYGVQPMQPSDDNEQPPALFLTLHGANVDALHQASCYANKTWGHVVAPTNRRPFGFDWESWGRIDAMEVLALAEHSLGTDPRRTYLTGHSMGGHGVWQIGAHYPDRFAAIAPSAGWISFRSYTGAERFENATPIEQLLHRAMSPSDTLALSRNYLQHGVYILHGEQDDNVPVAQARTMRAHLSEFHPNFVYYERPGAGHWWGNQCVDWPPLFDFLAQNTRPHSHTVHHIEFVTANPALSATCHWATIEQQVQGLQPSRIDLYLDPEKRVIRGTTENVAQLRIDLVIPGHRPGEAPQTLFEPGLPFTTEIDGDRLVNTSTSDHLVPIRFTRHDGHWYASSVAPGVAQRTWEKGPHRGGPFAEAFRNHVRFVYATDGTPEENDWARNKARYDAETFWWRGNGSIDVIPDYEFVFDPTDERNVILYGNGDTNLAWQALFADCPVQVQRGGAQIGDRWIDGDEWAVLAIYPRPRSNRALVGIVSGTGLVGLNLTNRLSYFTPGVAYPDWIVIGPEMLQSGSEGVLGTGFYANDWTIDSAQSAWREL